MKPKHFLLPVSLMIFSHAFSQVFTNKEVGKKNEALTDSLKKSDYPYSLPIWGAKATAAGYDLPYSAGLSIQYFGQVSDLVFDNLKVGFNNGPMYDMDGLVRFDKARSTAQAVTVRPDIWILPFLNVYGILGKAAASTEVGFGVWIQDSSNTDKQIFSGNSIVEFQSTTFGLGFTPTIGIAGGFLALDMNVAWTDIPQLERPVMTFVFGPRVGKNFKLKKPQQSLAVWVGGFRVHLNSETTGSISLSEVLPTNELAIKVENGQVRVDDAQQQVDAWWAGLTPVQQRNPVNVAKYNAANAGLAGAGRILTSAENAINNGTSTVQYSMDRRVKDPWNFIVGSQFQLNKHFMLRAEYGFLGSRTQIMTGLQYRFGL